MGLVYRIGCGYGRSCGDRMLIVSRVNELLYNRRTAFTDLLDSTCAGARMICFWGFVLRYSNRMGVEG
jgi:hypothetical protein